MLDPFAGTGRIHELENTTRGIELEWEWASMHPATEWGDTFDTLPRWIHHGVRFDAVCTSPTYGNRMADHHEAKDASKRNTYRHALERPLSPNNSGAMQWGVEYRSFHERAWYLVHEILRPGGRFVLNVKDHIRRDVLQPVVAWHRATCLLIGFTLSAVQTVELSGNGFGQNGNTRVPYEVVLVFDK